MGPKMGIVSISLIPILSETVIITVKREVKAVSPPPSRDGIPTVLSIPGI